MNTACGSTDELLIGFIEEAIESLEDLPAQLEQFRRNSDNNEPIAHVFRAVHTIKGNAGFFRLRAIKEFSHRLENTLDELRDGRLSLSENLQRAIVDGLDTLDEMVQQVADGTVRDELDARETDLLTQIAELAAGCRPHASGETKLLNDLRQLADEIGRSEWPQSKEWSDRLMQLAQGDQEADDTDGSGGETETPSPASFADAKLECQGQDVGPRVAAVLQLFLAAERGELNEDLGKAFMAAAAEFAVWCEENKETELAAALWAAEADHKAIDESPVDLDPTLTAMLWDSLGPALNKLKVDDDAVASQEVLESAEPAANSQSSPTASKGRLIRVKEERLDSFIEDVASLFVTCERFKHLHSRLASAEMETLIEESRQINETLSSQTRNLQQSVVALRRVSIHGLLSKFPRLARSLASQMGKKIDVHIEGEETEVDKSLFEGLDAPLTHIVRNAVDHAIELPAERLQRGVGEIGNLWLRAEANRSFVIVTVQDDGRGIDPERLRAKAVENGLYTQAQADSLSDQEAVELVFHAGLSTAEQLSDVSGRGVGMDVVRSNLREHNADVTIQSELGVGTTVRMMIPVREAVVVVDGLLVEQAGEKIVLPLNDVLEIRELSPVELRSARSTNVVDVRGKLYAAQSLGTLLDLPSSTSDQAQAMVGVITETKRNSMCLLVDKILGQRKIVINGLQDVFPDLHNLSGVAQLGGGQLALVVNVAELTSHRSATP